MKYRESMIAWTPADDGGGKVQVDAWPDPGGWSDQYLSTCGACYTFLHDLSDFELTQQLLCDFVAVLRDVHDTKAVIEQFAKIDEFREACIAGSDRIIL